MVPIVLIPGHLCTAELFAAQIPALWPHGPVTIASTSGETMAGIAAAILAAAPPRFALAGISMGGYIAFEILRQAPERIVKLGLLDTTARPDTPEQSDRRRALLALARDDFDAAMAGPLSALLHPDHRGDPGLNAINLRMAQVIGLEGLAQQTEAIIGRPDSRPDLAAIAVPTRIIVGDGDALTPPDLAREMAAAIPGAQLTLIPDSGHASPIEQPQAVSAALIDWISG